ncbi:MAG: FadR/GntR family transcriptional regulator [Cypionkella sp.]
MTISLPTESAQTEADLLAVMNSIAGSSPLDVMRVRMIVEPQAAAVAAANARESDLETIRHAHQMAVISVEKDAFEGWDGEFHKRIFESTRNDFLTTLHDILMAIRSRPQWIELKRKTFSTARRNQYCEEHAAILAAIEGRDAQGASEAMRAHMGAVQHNMFMV